MTPISIWNYAVREHLKIFELDHIYCYGSFLQIGYTVKLGVGGSTIVI